MLWTYYNLIWCNLFLIEILTELMHNMHTGPFWKSNINYCCCWPSAEKQATGRLQTTINRRIYSVFDWDRHGKSWIFEFFFFIRSFHCRHGSQCVLPCFFLFHPFANKDCCQRQCVILKKLFLNVITEMSVPFHTYGADNWFVGGTKWLHFCLEIRIHVTSYWS